MINPEYFRGTNKEKLGIQTFQGLLLLGYWKKLLFLVDLESGLALAQTFSDYVAYKQLFHSYSPENVKSSI